jgi:plastocyanin
MLSRRSCATALAALLTLSVAACGDPSRVEANRDLATGRPVPSIDATVNPKPSKSPSAEPSTPASDEPSASESASGGGGGGSTVEATPANQFSPTELKVKVGTKVTWTNPGSGFHTVTGGTPSSKDPSQIHAPLQFKTFSVTFEKAGTYEYFCEPHAPTMTGKIVVE